jgi:hypothetical protein
VFSSATITGHMYDRFPLALFLFVYVLLQAVKEDGGDRGWVPVRSYSKDKTLILSDCPCTLHRFDCSRGTSARCPHLVGHPPHRM